MTSLRTHYDNLKVARDAPIEVIKAAYKSLAQRYHPDRNPGDKEAERIMQLINKSYSVLSNPEEKAEHDRWIASQEQVAASGKIPTRPDAEKDASPFAHHATARHSATSQERHVPNPADFMGKLFRFRPIYSIGILLYIIWLSFNTSKQGYTAYSAMSIMPKEEFPRTVYRSNTHSESETKNPSEMPSLGMNLKNMTQQFSHIQTIQGIYADITKARQVGMNDDMIYLQLMQSKKWERKIKNMSRNGVDGDNLAKIFGLQLSDNTHQNTTHLLRVEKNFFDETASSGSEEVALFSQGNNNNNKQLVENLINAYSNTPAVQPLVKKRELIKILSSSTLSPDNVQEKIHNLQAKGIPDQDIYKSLLIHSPFTDVIKQAKQEKFSDREIAEIFGLTL